MRILITGGLGFIGSYFAERLSDGKSNSVVILDNLTGHAQEARDILGDRDNIQIIEADVSKDDITPYFKDIELVYHFAANSKISEGVNNPAIDFEVTALGTHKVLSAMHQNDVERIIFTSGSGVYGDQNDMHLKENFGPLLPVSYYGASKLAAEAYISAFVGMNDMKASIFRFANVVGLRQTHGVAFDFFYKLKNDPSSLYVLGNGLQSKSYIDVADIFSAVELVREEQTSNIDVFNVATEDYITVREIAGITISTMELENVKVTYEDQSAGWVGDVPIIRFDTGKLRSLGWKNELNSSQAIERAVLGLIKNDNN